MLPGEQVVVLTAGATTDPDSGELLPDWATPTETTVEDVLVNYLGSEPLADISGAVTSRLTLYFQTVPTVPLAHTRVRIRGVDYDVSGQPSDWRMGSWHPGLEVPVVDTLTTRRTVAEALMVDTCRVEHQTGSTNTDAGGSTGIYDTLYTGKCRVQLVGAGSQALRDVGDQQVSVLTIQVQLPVVGTEGIHVRDRITILRATNDTDLVGREFRVTQPAPDSDAAARLLQCVEVTA